MLINAPIPRLEVIPGLYIGNFRDSKDQEQLKLNNITHIISIHDNPKQLNKDKEYLCIIAADTPNQNLQQYVTVCNDFIHNARINGGNVLIHCLAGVSRSVTITVAYIMSTTGLSYRDSLNTVRGARQVANPNYGFQKQLLRLRDKFPSSSFKDEQECRKLLVAYHSSARKIQDSKSTTPEPCDSRTKPAHQPSSSVCGSPSHGSSPKRSAPSPRLTPRASPRSSPRTSLKSFNIDLRRKS
ncbi:Dual specificity protein phosphatase 22 [Nymphon striatum]|nr:Dual specificity protein phosphatase 22 [Nymphon striatum]